MPISAAIIEQLESIQACAGALGLSRKARQRLGWLIYHFRSGASVSDTCKTFGIARITFYRLFHRFDPARPETLEDRSRRPHTIHSSLSAEALALIRQYRSRQPEIDHHEIASLLATRHGISTSPSTVYRALAREHLLASPQHLAFPVQRKGLPV